jgi:hypothetical protein
MQPGSTVIVTRKNIIKHWSREPKWTPIPDDIVLMDGPIGFPDLNTLSPQERELLRPVLATHPEYLLGAVWFGGMLQ